MKCKNSCDSRSFIQVGICILILGHFLRKREYIPHTLYALTFFSPSTPEILYPSQEPLDITCLQEFNQTCKNRQFVSGVFLVQAVTINTHWFSKPLLVDRDVVQFRGQQTLAEGECTGQATCSPAWLCPSQLWQRTELSRQDVVHAHHAVLSC